MASFVWRYGVLREIAQSKEVQAVCKRGAQSAAAQATGISKHGYKVDVKVGTFRAHARATTLPDAGAYWSEVRTHALRHVKPKI